MYYLNDKHSQYQYIIYCKQNIQAFPYLIPREFESLKEVKIFLKENIEKRYDRCGFVYYIDNDFYNNNYPKNINGAYYKVLRRKVNDWKEFETTEDEKVLINHY